MAVPEIEDGVPLTLTDKYAVPTAVTNKCILLYYSVDIQLKNGNLQRRKAHIREDLIAVNWIIVRTILSSDSDGISEIRSAKIKKSVGDPEQN